MDISILRDIAPSINRLVVHELDLRFIYFMEIVRLLSQNIWEQRSHLKNRQRRRAELARHLLQLQKPKKILDIGCAEGFATSFLYFDNELYAMDIEFDNLRVAKEKVRNASFINASIEYLPFRRGTFDAVSILEVIEHLPRHLQEEGFREVGEVLAERGSVLLSIPYKENIVKTKCIHCGSITPLYGHLHSMDESYIESLVPSQLSLIIKKKYRIPNLEFVSCSDLLGALPFRVWLIINSALEKMRKGYWMVLLLTH